MFNLHVLILITGKDPDGCSAINNSHSTSLPSTDQKNNSATDYSTSVSLTSSQRITLTQLLTNSEPEELKLTEDRVITALNDHLLEDHILPFGHLQICETLGEGKI